MSCKHDSLTVHHKSGRFFAARCSRCGIDFVPADAIARARREALEEAAREAETWLHVPPKNGWEAGDALDAKAAYSNGTVRRIAHAIRALSDTPKAPETDGETPAALSTGRV